MLKSSRDRLEIKALLVLRTGEEEAIIEEYLQGNGVRFERLPDISYLEEIGPLLPWDLVLLDADMDNGDIVGFFQLYMEKGCSIPVVALHNGSRGGRDASLVRMGAFDAFPRDIGRWNTEVYLDRALHQARLVKRLLILSRTDHVTGLFNQRYLYEVLEREVRRSTRTGSSLTIALLDLDNFKVFNDKFGHLEGDRMLSEVAGLLEASIRRSIDSAFRYGGDEFMLILPETDLSSARGTVDRIVSQARLRGSKEVTFSTGLSLLQSCANIESFIRSVDRAMYQSKRSGGDRITTTVCDDGLT